MQPDYMRATMENIFAVWKKPVNLATVMDGEGKIFTWDGNEFRQEQFGNTKTAAAAARDEEKGDD